MSAKHLIIGLDGADLGIVQSLATRLPNLTGLMHSGAYAALESVMPPATLPAWTTFLTGMNPGAHGVFDFTTRQGYNVRFTAGSVREVPTVFTRLDQAGLSCACLGFPATWPPEKLVHGVFMSGWDSPVAFEADRSFIHPPAWYDLITERFGRPRFDDVDEFATGERGWHRKLPTALEQRIVDKTAFGTWMLQQRSWDAFAIYFGETDTASHHLYNLYDHDSPRRPGGLSHGDADGLARVYVAADRAVGQLIDAAGGDEVEITVVSDHGSGGSSDVVLYLNRALAAAGLLRFKEQSNIQPLFGMAKEGALRWLPPWIRDRAFRMMGARLPGLVESQTRFGAIDMDRTRAFSDELNYFPSVHINRRGREPRGQVAEADIASTVLEVSEALFAIENPFTGEPVVANVHRREDIYRGAHVDRAPDLVLELHLTEGYSYNLMPSSTAPPGTGPFRRLATSERLGRKGRSLPGSHRPRGFYAAAGPRIAAVGQLEAAIGDASATMLTRMGHAVPSDACGRVLWEALREPAAHSRAAPVLGGSRTAAPAFPAKDPAAGSSAPANERRARVERQAVKDHHRAFTSGDGERVIERRLRALGYID